jgi:exopolysaccharide biosynthesis polyprenyl glycosylphosphotransferase
MTTSAIELLARNGSSDGPDSAFRRSPTAKYPGSRVRYPHRLASWCLAASTLVALVAAALIWSTVLSDQWTILSLLAALITFAALLANGYFRVNMAEGGRFKVRLAGSASMVGVAVGLFAVSVAGLDEPGSTAFVGLALTLTATATVSRLVGRAVLEQLWRNGRLRASALVLGDDPIARELAVELGIRPACGVDIVGFVTDSTSSPSPQTTSQPVFRLDTNSSTPVTDQLHEAVEAVGAMRLIIGPCGSVDDRIAQAAARWAARQGMPVHIVPRFHQMGMGLDSMSPDRSRGYPLVRLQRSAHPTLSRKLKRLLDVTLASSVLILASPVLLASAAAVRLSSPGKILYAQTRVGQGGRLITIHKFRSMTETGDGATEWNSEARITPIGRWLRRTNVDELPQLLSIIKGDMSLVGPRPERPAFVEEFGKVIPDYDDRHRVPVGLTGLAQVIGLRGDTSISERVKYDNLYIDQWSLRRDLEILVETLPAMAFQHRRSRQVSEVQEAVATSESR